MSDFIHYSSSNPDPLLMEFSLETSYSKIFNIPHNDEVILTETPLKDPPFTFRKAVILQLKKLTSYWSFLTKDIDYEKVQFMIFHSAMSNTVYKIYLKNEDIPFPFRKKEPASFILRIFGTGTDTSYITLMKTHEAEEEHHHQQHQQPQQQDKKDGNSPSTLMIKRPLISSSTASFGSSLLRDISSGGSLTPLPVSPYSPPGIDAGTLLEDSDDSSKHAVKKTTSSASLAIPIRIATSPPPLSHSLESLWMLCLSEQKISPHVYGQFGNGRIEETILDGSPLSAETLRISSISKEIAYQLGKLHSCTDSMKRLAIKLYRNYHQNSLQNAKKVNEMIYKDLNYWQVIMKSFSSIEEDLIAHGSGNDGKYRAFRYEDLVPKITIIEKLLLQISSENHVFIHSDLQYGNIMSPDKDLRSVTIDEFHESGNSMIAPPTIILIDYEYGSFGPRSFDIANHFFEWMCNYHTATPEKIHPKKYPNESQIRVFLTSYFSSVISLSSSTISAPATISHPVHSSLSTSSLSSFTDGSQHGHHASSQHHHHHNHHHHHHRPSSGRFSSSASTSDVVTHDLSEKVHSFLHQHWEAILLELKFFTLISDLKWAFWGIEQYNMRTKATAAEEAAAKWKAKDILLEEESGSSPSTSSSSDETAAVTETETVEAQDKADPHQFYLDYSCMRITHFWNLQEEVLHKYSQQQQQRRYTQDNDNDGYSVSTPFSPISPVASLSLSRFPISNISSLIEEE
jgi:thiamine kinase-like enzyme